MAFAGLDAVGGGDNAHQSDAAGSIRTSARTEYQAASSAFAQLRAPEKAAKISAYPVEMAGFARKCRPNPGCAMKEKQRTSDANKYHYVECGLPNVWLRNGFEKKQTPYGDGVSIFDIEGLHGCIARTLCDKPVQLTGREFRFLRRELDFSQKMIGEIFGRSDRSIRDLEHKEAAKEPYNGFIRHLYLESIDPNISYIDLFKRLRDLDIEWHEPLTLMSDGAGNWSVTDAA